MWRLLALFLLAAAPAMATPRIADLWYAHNEITVMLGAADHIVVTVARPQSFPWMYRMAPQMRGALVVANGAPNAEALLAANVQLAFIASPAQAAPLTALGVDCEAVGFTNAASLLASVQKTALAIGTPQARRRAGAYAAGLAGTMAFLQARLGHIPVSTRPRVLHLASLTPLRADGAGTIIDDWITRAGGIDAAAGLRGNLQPVSLEQIAAWNPDVIIVGGGQGAVPETGLWADLKAVRAHQVYQNPVGVFPWDRYGTEYELQLLWAAKLLHPALFADVDMQARMAGFYQSFFGYTLSAADAQRILHAQPPA